MKHLVTALPLFWVMWHTEYSTATYKYTWKPGDFFESTNQCREAVFELIELRVKEAKQKNPSSDFVKFEVPETGVLGYYSSDITDDMPRFTCLPEGRKPA